VAYLGLRWVWRRALRLRKLINVEGFGDDR
jgi:hypothetical protein